MRILADEIAAGAQDSVDVSKRLEGSTLGGKRVYCKLVDGKLTAHRVEGSRVFQVRGQIHLQLLTRVSKMRAHIHIWDGGISYTLACNT